MFKKLFLLLCLLALCITVSSAGITDKLKSVIARKNVAAGNGAASGYYDPTGTAVHETTVAGAILDCTWGDEGINIHLKIDNGVRTPTDPNNTDGADCLITNSVSPPGTNDIFHWTTDSVSGTITTVRLYAFCETGSGNWKLDISDDGSSWEGAQIYACEDPATWIYHDWSVSWANTVIYVSHTGDLDSWAYIEAAYIEVNP